MSSEEPIRSINITPTPEAMQRIVRILQDQIIASQEKIAATEYLHAALYENDIYYSQFTRKQNAILYEALDIGLDHIITQEEERIQHIQDGLTPTNDEEGA